MQLSPKLTYEAFCKVADKLFFEQKEMPSAAKTHKIIGHGSLQTHQHYLDRWRESGKPPLTLPEQLARKIHEKTLVQVEEIWKILEEAQQEKTQKIQQEAKETIEKAANEVKEALLAAQKSQDTLKVLQHQYDSLQREHKECREVFRQTEKEYFVLAEKNKALDKQFHEYKAEVEQQLNYLKEQDQKNRELFKEQLKAQERKAEDRYLSLQKEKATEKVNAEKTIAKMKAEQKQLEAKLFQRQAEIEKSRAEAHHLKQLLDKMEREKKAFIQENQKFKADCQKKEHRISHVQGENYLLQKKVEEFQERVMTLQEEVLRFRKKGRAMKKN